MEVDLTKIFKNRYCVQWKTKTKDIQVHLQDASLALNSCLAASAAEMYKAHPPASEPLEQHQMPTVHVNLANNVRTCGDLANSLYSDCAQIPQTNTLTQALTLTVDQYEQTLSTAPSPLHFLAASVCDKWTV